MRRIRNGQTQEKNVSLNTTLIVLVILLGLIASGCLILLVYTLTKDNTVYVFVTKKDATTTGTSTGSTTGSTTSSTTGSTTGTTTGTSTGSTTGTSTGTSTSTTTGSTTGTTTGMITTTPLPLPPSQNATFVYGQIDCVSNVDLPVSASSLNTPYNTHIDPFNNQNIYIVDTFNSRVLYYNGLNTTAVRVYGQHNVFTTSGPNEGGISIHTLAYPRAVFATCEGVYIVDGGNNRIFFCPNDSIVPTMIYGQISDGVNLPNAGYTTQKMSFSGPESIFIDHLGQMYVCDTGNNRVLMFPKNSNIPEKIWGQSSFTSNTFGCSASELNGPMNIFVDTSLNLYVADKSNNRVLRFPVNSTTADIVYGQNNFVSCLANQGGSVSASTLDGPSSIYMDSTGIYIVDNNNNRILYYPLNSPSGSAATMVYGQNGNFTTNQPSVTPTCENLNAPFHCITNSNKDLYCADSQNNRVLLYPSSSPSGYDNYCSTITTSTTTTSPITTTPITPTIPSTTAFRVFGQLDFTSANDIPISSTSLNRPFDVTVDSNLNLVISDTFNSRVLYYTNNSTNATRVYGQGNVFDSGTSNNGGISKYTLSFPRSSVITSDGVYILDGGNNRLLYYPNDSTTPTLLFGQVSDVLNTPNANIGSAAMMTFKGPEGLFIDHIGQIYVADTGNNRVIKYPKNSNIPTQVWGQVSFATDSLACTSTGLNMPCDVYVDFDFNVYIADTGNNRVLKYNANSTTAVQVYGQPDFTTCTIPGTPSGTTLNQPSSVDVDEFGGVYISDSSNNRVLYYPYGSLNATVVYGQNSFNTDMANQPSGTPTATNLDGPGHCDYILNQLYCTDVSNHRVLVY